MKNAWIQYGVPINFHSIYCKNVVISSQQSSDLIQPTACSLVFLKPVKYGKGANNFPSSEVWYLLACFLLSSFLGTSHCLTTLTRLIDVKWPKQRCPLICVVDGEVCQVVWWGCMACFSSVGKAWDQEHKTEISSHLTEEAVMVCCGQKIGQCWCKEVVLRQWFAGSIVP